MCRLMFFSISATCWKCEAKASDPNATSNQTIWMDLTGIEREWTQKTHRHKGMLDVGGLHFFQMEKPQCPRSSVCSLYTVEGRDGLLPRVEKGGGVTTYR